MRKKQLFELIFVPAFAFLPSLIYSVSVFIKGTEIENYGDVSASIVFTLIYECASLSLLYFVLYRRYETFRDLGLNFTWNQLLSGLVLAALVFAVSYGIEWILIKTLPVEYLKSLSAKNTGFIPNNFSLLFFVFIVVNAFAEEMIVRAFIIRETFSLTNSKTFAVLISVIFQMAYHLYQGLLPTLILGLVFFIYSIFYIRTGKLTSVIIAHFIMDIISIFIIRHQ